MAGILALERLGELQRRFGVGLLSTCEDWRVGERTGGLSMRGKNMDLRIRGEVRVGEVFDSERPRFLGTFKGEISPSRFKGTLETV